MSEEESEVKGVYIWRGGDTENIWGRTRVQRIGFEGCRMFLDILPTLAHFIRVAKIILDVYFYFLTRILEVYFAFFYHALIYCN